MNENVRDDMGEGKQGGQALPQQRLTDRALLRVI